MKGTHPPELAKALSEGIFLRMGPERSWGGSKTGVWDGAFWGFFGLFYDPFFDPFLPVLQL